MLASIPQPIEEGDYEWIVRQIADVEQVHDGHIGASNSNEFSWQVYGDLVVLSESSLIDGRTSCSILPNSGTPSIDFCRNSFCICFSARLALYTAPYRTRLYPKRNVIGVGRFL